jgi:hypothetical protein
MEEGFFISKYFKKIKEIMNQFASIDEKLEEQQVVQITLSALKPNCPILLCHNSMFDNCSVEKRESGLC